MAIRVVPYTAEWVDAVLAFNARMHGAGVHWGWYGSPVDDWLPERDGRKTWREHYLAVEDGTTVRGAYALKPHEWRVGGRPLVVTDWQGPISEGAFDRRYNTLGLRLLREMLRQYPLLYSWGHGGMEQPMLAMLVSLGWTLHPTPFLLRVLRPVRFLRRNRYLRGTPARRLALDLAAWTGAGSIGLRAFHAALRQRHRRSAPATAEPFERFEAWADELFERCAPRYAALACRDAATMNALLPDSVWPRAVRLRVRRDDADLGWCVVFDTPMTGDARFGDLRVATLVDCLALPEHAEAVVGAADRFARQRGADLVISNQAHPAWVEAFAAHGYHVLQGRRLFAASPQLRDALEPFDEVARGLHMTNMDGHGPQQL